MDDIPVLERKAVLCAWQPVADLGCSRCAWARCQAATPSVSLVAVALAEDTMGAPLSPQ